MTPRRLSAAKRKQESKKKKNLPETDDEWLSEAVSLEEAAEKWRAGDPQKAARFYSRALEVYEDALKLYPHSFDLMYNRARLQYEITQIPVICETFSTSTEELLRTTLQSHKRTLDIDPHSADLIFNTAQVLTSLAEVTDNDNEALQMLQEAIALFQTCLAQQKVLLQEQGQRENLEQSSSGDESANYGVPTEPDRDAAAPVLEWATLEEPVTEQSLIDTAVAMLGALSTCCGVVPELQMLISIGETAGGLLDELLPAHFGDQTVANMSNEMICTSTKFRASLFEAEFRLGSITYSELDDRLQGLWNFAVSRDAEVAGQSSETLLCCADALISFAAAGSGVSNAGVLRYKRLTTALDILAEASKLPDAKDIASIHMARGDAEMFRLCVCLSSTVPESIGSKMARETLLRNAGTFYRGAAATAQADSGLMNRTTTTANIKKAVTECIAVGNNKPLRDLSTSGMDEIEMQKVVARMVEDSLVTEETLRLCAVL